jgi:hypothetical protein
MGKVYFDPHTNRTTYHMKKEISVPVIAMRTLEKSDTAHGATTLDMGDNIHAKVVIDTRPTTDGNVYLELAVTMAEGKPPDADDDRLLCGVDFKTTAPTQGEAFSVAREFLKQRLETDLNIMTVINTQGGKEQ